jgi:hypothetical protein
LINKDKYTKIDVNKLELVQPAFLIVILYAAIYIVKNIINTKAVEALAFVLLKKYFSQHMNQEKHFTHFETNVKCLVRNV